MARRSTESGRDEDEQAALRGQVDVEATLSLPRHHFPISTQHHQTTDFLHLSSRNPHRPSTHTSTLLQQTGHDRFPPSFFESTSPTQTSSTTTSLPPKFHRQIHHLSSTTSVRRRLHVQNLPLRCVGLQLGRESLLAKSRSSSPKSLLTSYYHPWI